MQPNPKDLTSIFKELSNQVNKENPDDVLDFAIKYLQAKKQKEKFNYTPIKEVGEKRTKSQEKEVLSEQKVVKHRRAASSQIKKRPKKNLFLIK